MTQNVSYFDRNLYVLLSKVISYKIILLDLNYSKYLKLQFTNEWLMATKTLKSVSFFMLR